MFSAVVVVCATFLAVTPARADWENLATGVDYEARSLPGPITADVIRINLCAQGVHMRATAPDEKYQRTSAWGAQTGVVAAINAGFFKGSSLDNGVGVGNRIVWPGSNRGPTRNEVAFGPNVAEISEVDGEAVPSYWEQAASGDAMLVRDGQPQHGIGGVCPNRNPLTAIGFSQDGTTAYLVTVDGRNPSKGMTCNEMADFLVSYGAWQALRLDGGGSTTMWINGRGLVSNPSDAGGERTVLNHIGVYSYGDGPPRSCVTRDVPNFLNGVKRHVPSTTSVTNWKYGIADVIAMDDGVLNMFTEGKPMPEGPPILWQNEAKNTLWLIEGPVKRQVLDLYGIVTWKFHTQTLEVHTDAELDALLTGSPLPQTPVVVKGSGDAVYVLDHPLPYRMQITNAVWPSSVQRGTTAEVKLTVQNVGGIPWKPGEVSLRPSSPKDADSPLCDKSWDSCKRITSVNTEVAFAATTELTFLVRGATLGATKFCVNLVGQKETWFSDPAQGGPADDANCATIEVTKGRPGAGGCGVVPGSDGKTGTSLFTLLALGAALRRRRSRHQHPAREILR